jgi:prevent-host-death family protein
MVTIVTPVDPSSILPATTVKRRFLELLGQLGGERSVVTITRNGVPAGVLMSVEEYEALLETVEILADPGLMRALRRARRGFARGRTLRHDQVWPKD